MVAYDFYLADNFVSSNVHFGPFLVSTALCADTTINVCICMSLSVVARLTLSIMICGYNVSLQATKRKYHVTKHPTLYLSETHTE